MKHPRNIEGYPGSLEELGEELADLQYDCLVKVLHSLSVKLEKDAWEDSEKGRRELAMKLSRASYQVGRARDLLARAWGLCKPHMEKEE